MKLSCNVILVFINPCWKHFAFAFPWGCQKSGSATKQQTVELKEIWYVDQEHFSGGSNQRPLLKSMVSDATLCCSLLLSYLSTYYTHTLFKPSAVKETFFYNSQLPVFNVFSGFSGVKIAVLLVVWPSLNFWLLWHLTCKNKFLLLSWLKIQHSGGWHVAQPATSVYSLLNIGWGKHFHPHRLPPAFHEWNWRQSLSSQLSLVETHWLGTLNTLYCTLLFWRGYLS